MALLELEGLSVGFAREEGELLAVEDVSLHVEPGELVALVGESGCGKSLTASSLLGLVPETALARARRFHFDGRPVDLADPASVGALRGRGIGMVFQDPLAALDPVETIGAQLVETVRTHEPLSRAAARARAIELLVEAGIADGANRLAMVPHQLSGGLRQRVTLALALAGSPKLLVADEATTALDPTLRRGLVDYLDRLRKTRGLAVLFVTHDLGLVAHAADRIAVMYCGRVVETGRRDDVLASAAHPYTRGLLGCAPELGRTLERLPTIPGVVPPLGRWPEGCTFAPRCERAADDCRGGRPPHRPSGATLAACLHPYEAP